MTSLLFLNNDAVLNACQLDWMFVFSAVQRKIYRLIASDFCSWVPISIMAFVNFSGVTIPSVAYPVSAIVLLPINSALNPILHFDIFGPFIRAYKNFFV